MNGGEPPEKLRDDPADADDQLDEGRRYWKAAIAHLAPEKREAAWEFYLDRLESSPAADTLGGIMLLLEAHLAFFDDLPAKLGAAAQRIESVLKPLDGENHACGSSPPRGNMVDRGNGALRSPGRKCPPVITVTVSALLGGIVACAGLLAYQHHRLGEPVGRSAAIQSVLLARAPLLTVEPWSDPVAHREKGCVILIGNTAWTESTQAGGTKVYVLSPVEEVRRNLESLRQLTRQSTSKEP